MDVVHMHLPNEWRALLFPTLLKIQSILIPLGYPHHQQQQHHNDNAPTHYKTFSCVFTSEPFNFVFIGFCKSAPWSFCCRLHFELLMISIHLSQYKLNIHAIVTFACCLSTFYIFMHISSHILEFSRTGMHPCIQELDVVRSRSEREFRNSSRNYQVDVIIIEHFRTFAAKQWRASSTPLDFHVLLDFIEGMHNVNRETKWMHRIIRKLLLWIVDFVFREIVRKILGINYFQSLDTDLLCARRTSFDVSFFVPNMSSGPFDVASTESPFT